MISKIVDDVRRDAIQKAHAALWAEEYLKELGDVIGQIASLALVAKKEGLLSLEEMANELEGNEIYHEMLKAGCNMICDGMDPENMEEYLTTMYWMNAPKGEKALIAYNVIRGLDMIYSGTGVFLAERVLLLGFSEDQKKICRKSMNERTKVYSDREREREAKEYESFEYKIREDETQILVENLENKLAEMTEKMVQRLLRDVDNYQLVHAMIGMSGEVRERIFGNMSKRLKEMLISDLLRGVQRTPIGYVTSECQIREAIEKILEIIKRLEDRGEFLFL